VISITLDIVHCLECALHGIALVGSVAVTGWFVIIMTVALLVLF